MDVHPTKNVSIGIDPYPNKKHFLMISPWSNHDQLPNYPWSTISQKGMFGLIHENCPIHRPSPYRLMAVAFCSGPMIWKWGIPPNDNFKRKHGALPWDLGAPNFWTNPTGFIDLSDKWVSDWKDGIRKIQWIHTSCFTWYTLSNR